MFVPVVVAKPGASTTTALALAAAARARATALYVEMDPSGGDLACWRNLEGEPGLFRAVELSAGAHPDALLGCTVEALPGLSGIVAPSSPRAATAALASANTQLGLALGRLDGIVVADAGRWDRDQTTAGRISGAWMVAVACHPTVAGVEHARHLVAALNDAHHRVAAVVLGDRPYPGGEVAAVLDVPVGGVLAWDPPAVERLIRYGPDERWARTRLARSASEVVDGLVRMAWEAYHVGS